LSDASKHNPAKDYHGSDLYRPEWETPHDIRNWLASSVFTGTVLNVCSGPSPLGDVRVDVDSSPDPDVVANLHDLPFPAGAFDTVYVDPPYSLYAYPHGYWPKEAWRVARERLVLESPGKRVTLPRTDKSWYLAEPRPGASLMAVKLFQVFDRDGASLESFVLGEDLGRTSRGEDA
jgi:hypothetical protein